MAMASYHDRNEAIQIVTPVDHSFVVKLNNLQQVLDVEGIKNRNVVVVSVAGAFRQGKSFLMNFFLRYLNAQYKKHDVTDWLGENGSCQQLNGFKWRGGQKPETIGIWMWSEIFTHDFENGDKVAIILLDTQGIFDSKSSVQDCTTIFALSTLLSSIQCYNLMHNIREDDLQHLELFTEYGRLVLEQSNEKPFQSLLFIVRDWPFAFETGYGLQGKRFISEMLAKNIEQTPEMHYLRSRIESSFNEIGAFLLPHPGLLVAQDNTFTGDIQQIDVNFKRYVKELAPALFAPKNLIVKTINGQKVRARDLMQYFQTYVAIFNGNTLPEPKSVLMATAEASNLILYNDSLNYYIESMQKALNDVEFYFKKTKFVEIHNDFKRESLSQFHEKPKLGGEVLISKFECRMEDAIEENFLLFQQQNDEKLKNFTEKSILHNTNISNEIKIAFEKKMFKIIEDNTVNMRKDHLSAAFQIAHSTALEEFNARKFGDHEINSAARERLDCDLLNLKSTTEQVLISFEKCLNVYEHVMLEAFSDVDSYFDENGLMDIHHRLKRSALEMFEGEIKQSGDEISSYVHRKIENDIEAKYILFAQNNEKKRRDFIETINAQNEKLIHQIEMKVRQTAISQINDNDSYFSALNLWNLYKTQKEDALNEFHESKMGNIDISDPYREKLEQSLENFYTVMKQENESKRIRYIRIQEEKKARKRTRGGLFGTVVGAVVGFVTGGPVGAAVGSKAGEKTGSEIADAF